MMPAHRGMCGTWFVKFLLLCIILISVHNFCLVTILQKRGDVESAVQDVRGQQGDSAACQLYVVGLCVPGTNDVGTRWRPPAGQEQHLHMVWVCKLSELCVCGMVRELLYAGKCITMLSLISFQDTWCQGWSTAQYARNHTGSTVVTDWGILLVNRNSKNRVDSDVLVVRCRRMRCSTGGRAGPDKMFARCIICREIRILLRCVVLHDNTNLCGIDNKRVCILVGELILDKVERCFFYRYKRTVEMDIGAVTCYDVDALKFLLCTNATFIYIRYWVDKILLLQASARRKGCRYGKQHNRSYSENKTSSSKWYNANIDYGLPWEEIETFPESDRAGSGALGTICGCHV